MNSVPIFRYRYHPFLTVIAAISLILLGIGAAYLVWINMLRDQERLNPSTERVLVTTDGQRIPLTQPSPTVVASATAEATLTAVETQVTLKALVTPTPEIHPLPPERLIIPRININWPVTLADIDHLPKFRGVGWIFGTAFPGTPGNMVLTGHAGGPYATFERLHELQRGDEILVQTESSIHRYRVQTVYETSPDDVLVMAPSDRMIATLITCSGDWIPERQMNARRLIVVAVYEGRQ
ncbi:MAG: sortase [Roseiflexus sp.]|nr:sortase [Roseiflexus sp.]MCS7288872.1 sortase [Roseiflexus sp.]MDW8232255.1 sortase [Roseiflexaceae bacterium]